eukprot:gene19793-21733_t
MDNPENIIIEETSEDVEEADNSDSFTSYDVADNDKQYELKRKESSEYDTDLDIEEGHKEFDATGKARYLETCEKLSTTPASFVLRHLNDTAVNLRYHGIGTRGAIALANALFTNTAIVDVDLYENFIGPKGIKAISDMLKENCCIVSMNLGRNSLKQAGCKTVTDMMQSNISLKKLDLSSNHMGDRIGDYLADAIRSNYGLKWLNLSDNDFGEKVGVALGPAINSNDALEHLDLSWNQIRGKGAQDIATGLWTNCTLSYLNLSWNGFGNIGALALAEALSANNTLTELDVSYNRIGADGATALARGIQKNNTLEILRMDGNPITSNGAHTILAAIDAMAEISINKLYFRGILVDEDFDKLYERVKETKKIEVLAECRQITSLEKLLSLIAENKDRWTAVLGKLDPNSTLKVAQNEFFDAVKSMGLLLNNEEKLSMTAKLKSDRHGNILYRDTSLGFPKNSTSETTKDKQADQTA